MRIWPGHVAFSASTPETPFPSSGVPDSGSRISGSTPKNGTVAAPGLVGTAPGSGVMRIPPVSVCHHVSTIGERPLPTWVLYQRQASGLSGSPTDPSSLSEGMSYLSGSSSPRLAIALIAVGAV